MAALLFPYAVLPAPPFPLAAFSLLCPFVPFEVSCWLLLLATSVTFDPASACPATPPGFTDVVRTSTNAAPAAECLPSPPAFKEAASSSTGPGPGSALGPACGGRRGEQIAWGIAPKGLDQALQWGLHEREDGNTDCKEKFPLAVDQALYLGLHVGHCTWAYMWGKHA